MGEKGRSTLRSRGGHWVLAQGVVLLLGLPLPWLALSQGCGPLAVLVGAIGAGLGIFAMAQLGKALTPFPTPKVGGQLCQRGVYGLMRHPIYTGVMLMSWGWALAWPSLVALFWVLVVAGFLEAKASFEERVLLRTWPEYEIYRQRVGKFFPLIFGRH